MLSSSPLSLSAFIVSLREFTRNAKLRKKALREKRPVIVEQSRDESYFVLLPPALYESLFNLYQDMRDRQELQDAIKEQDGQWHDWNDVKKELSA